MKLLNQKLILIKNSNFLSTFKFITNLIKLFENLYFNYIDKLFDDLSFLESATKLIASYLSEGDIVIYESTVYPGVTEDVCVPILEKYSNLKSNLTVQKLDVDFRDLNYVFVQTHQRMP